MRFGSLFSGIGGLDLGLERAGMECAWQVENDAYATRVLAKHWPDVTRYGDITEVNFGRVEPVELLAGGFPCQDLSYAGRGLGLSGPRSGLWSEYKRAIRVVGPRYVLVENVPGLLGRGMGAVLGDLAALGYDAEWQSLPAAAFGAPHLRWRVFVVAYSRCAERRQGEWAGDEPHGEVAGRPKETGGPGASGTDGGTRHVADPDGGRWEGWPGEFRQTGRGEPSDGGTGETDVGVPHIRLPQGQRSHRLEVLRPRYGKEQPESPGDGAEHFWSVEPDVGRVAHGIPRRVDRLRGLGNAVVPQVAEYMGRLILDFDREAA